MTSNNARLYLHVLTALVLLLGCLAGPAMAHKPAAPGASSPATTAAMTSDQAIIAAVNDWQTTTDGWQLRHPRHTATFTPAGVQFAPRSGRIEWAWRLASVTADDRPLAGVVTDAVRPVRESSPAVTYSRGGLVEQYLARKSTIEQRFLIPQPLPLPAGGADLVIAGAVQCPGEFEATADGWRWREGDGAVRLGRVHVYDAAGRDLPATMAVTAAETRIVVDGTALAQAAYPVTIDPEIGADDFRISFMGKDTWYDANNPAVAYNSHDNEYLVVWQADDNSGSLADDEYEIYGQRVDAATGALIGSNFRISDMGGTGDANYDAYNPAVAYNSTDNQYLVVWEGDDNTAPLVDNEVEIFGQRLTAPGGGVGPNDFRISDMGPDGDANYDAIRPAVAYNSTNNEYLVVWQGDDDTGSLVNDENEIFAQRLNAATGAEIGADFRLSDMGGVGDADYNAYAPAVAYNSHDNQFLVVWEGDDDTGSLVDNEYEIYGQLLTAGGVGTGTNDFRISDMGGTGNADYDAINPAVAYDSQTNEYLVVWEGDDNTAPLVDGEFEIFGQRLNATGGGLGANDFRLSSMGPNGSTAYNAAYPAVAFSSASRAYLVVWYGDDNILPLVDSEFEIFGQQFTGYYWLYLPLILKNY